MRRPSATLVGMAKVWVVGVLVVVAAACDAGEPKTKECAAAAAAFDVGDAKQVQESCLADRWSAEAHECFAAATTEDSLKACTSKHLSRHQKDHLDAIPYGSPDAPIRAIAKFKNKMCACHDATCVKAVSDEMTARSTAIAKQRKEPPVNEADIKPIVAMAEELSRCMQTALAAPDTVVVPPIDEPTDRGWRSHE